MVLQGQETEYQTPADRTPALGHLSCRKSLLQVSPNVQPNISNHNR